MKSLNRSFSFRPWAPDLGENRETEPAALYFELATGLSQQQLTAMWARLARLKADITDAADTEAIHAAQRCAFIEALGEYVRIVDGPHLVAGMTLATLEDYVRIVQQQADFGQLALGDLTGALKRFNSFGGPDELFLPRRSGGSAGTGTPSVVKDSAPKEGR